MLYQAMHTISDAICTIHHTVWISKISKMKDSVHGKTYFSKKLVSLRLPAYKSLNFNGQRMQINEELLHVSFKRSMAEEYSVKKASMFTPSHSH